MSIVFNEAKCVFDEIKGLYTCTFNVSATGVPEQTKATGVGDSERQAKRHAIVTFLKQTPLIGLDLDGEQTEVELLIR